MSEPIKSEQAATFIRLLLQDTDRVVSGLNLVLLVPGVVDTPLFLRAVRAVNALEDLRPILRQLLGTRETPD